MDAMVRGAGRPADHDPEVPMNTARTARFAAAYALLRAGADIGDHWVIAALLVSTSTRVSVTRPRRRRRRGQSVPRVSRFETVVLVIRNAPAWAMGVAAA
ncbi:hypothetical protein [Kitasatospora purpeofusca]|uniref:hypothetical protein n=1 Tax=Kitasatospora purpeofusca TaxID=67352 RepID=UPI0036D3227C